MVRLLVKTKVTWDEVVAWTTAQCEGTEELSKFKHGLDYQWFKRWLERNKEELDVADSRPLEISRDEWCKSDNIGLHYVQVLRATAWP